MKILVVDDHPLFRDGIHAALTSAAQVTSVHEAGTVAEALELDRDQRPDVILMDLQLPDGSGIDATRAILLQHPEALVIILTMADDDTTVLAAMSCGARGYLLKGADRSTILGAIDAVSSGDVILGPGAAERVLAHLASSATRRVVLPELTDREREVAALLADGLTNHAIADRLFLSEKTVRNHVSNILMKLQVDTRALAGQRARQAGL